MLDVKQKVYSSVMDANLPLEDSPVMNRKNYPYGLVRTVSVVRSRYKNYYKANWLLKIDLFSSYAGEKECLDWFDTLEQKVFSDLMDDDQITYVQLSHDILDDKEQGPVTKHGIITIVVDTMEVPQQ